MPFSSSSGAATVEHAGLSLLVVFAALVAISAVAAGAGDSGRDLGSALGRKIRCAAVGPGPCWRDPLTLAYGRSLAGAVRSLAPIPSPRAGPQGPVLPVDFRECRTATCAAPGPSLGRTATNRAATVFVSVEDRRAGAQISYWLYLPGVGWEQVTRLASPARIRRLAPTPLLETSVPRLIALETLDGRNQFEFSAGEEPPWRWRVEPVVPATPYQ